MNMKKKLSNKKHKGEGFHLARPSWFETYEKTLEALSEYKGMHVNLDSEYAREAIAVSITDKIKGSVNGLRRTGKRVKRSYRARTNFNYG